VSSETTQEMEAGRALDVTVLVEVFGFPRKKVFSPEWTDDAHFIPSGKPRRTHMIDARPVPWFSTSIAAAWDVVEEAARRGMPATVVVAMGLDGNPDGWNATWAGMGAHAGTAPLAICRAALAAVRNP
jgi:hypothetical protein